MALSLAVKIIIGVVAAIVGLSLIIGLSVGLSGGSSQTSTASPITTQAATDSTTKNADDSTKIAAQGTTATSAAVVVADPSTTTPADVVIVDDTTTSAVSVSDTTTTTTESTTTATATTTPTNTPTTTKATATTATDAGDNVISTTNAMDSTTSVEGSTSTLPSDGNVSTSTEGVTSQYLPKAATYAITPWTSTTQHWAQKKNCVPKGLSPFSNSGVHDGVCDPALNHDECEYDGGDCCLPVIQDDLCPYGQILEGMGGDHIEQITTWDCMCHDDGTIHPNHFEDVNGGVRCVDYQLSHTYMANITNNICDDAYNYDICNWDGGACCSPRIDDRFCEDCICFEDFTRHPSKFQRSTEQPKINIWWTTFSWNWNMTECFRKGRDFASIGDSFCEQYNNYWECDFDGGDCCLGNVKHRRLHEELSKCHKTGLLHTHYFHSYKDMKVPSGWLLSGERNHCQDGSEFDLLGNMVPRENYFRNWKAMFNGWKCLDFGQLRTPPDDNPFNYYKPDKAKISTTTVHKAHVFLPHYRRDPDDPCMYKNFIANGICDPEANTNGNCEFDGGDCCLFFVDYSRCVFNATCVCYKDHMLHMDIANYPNCTGEHWKVQDGICQDELNTEACFYDGGDCCELPLDNSECTECLCKHMNIVMPTNITGNDFWPSFLAENKQHYRSLDTTPYLPKEEWNEGVIWNPTCPKSWWRCRRWNTNSGVNPYHTTLRDCVPIWNGVGLARKDAVLGQGFLVMCCEPLRPSTGYHCTKEVLYSGSDACKCTKLDRTLYSYHDECPKMAKAPTKDDKDKCGKYAMGDGFCMDGCNNELCNYDMADCCPRNRLIVDFLCDECLCKINQTDMDPTITAPDITRPNIKLSEMDCPIELLIHVADLVCDDVTNTPECGFDGGDCCPMEKPYLVNFPAPYYILFGSCKECRCYTNEDGINWLAVPEFDYQNPPLNWNATYYVAVNDEMWGGGGWFYWHLKVKDPYQLAYARAFFRDLVAYVSKQAIPIWKQVARNEDEMIYIWID